MLVFIAALSSALAAITGLLAVGNGSHWQFRNSDYLLGKRNAILYLWVIASASFSICHSGMLVEYGLYHQWEPKGSHAIGWMTLHTIIGVLLTLAHIFVAATLSNEPESVERYLWGKKSGSVR